MSKPKFEYMIFNIGVPPHMDTESVEYMDYLQKQLENLSRDNWENYQVDQKANKARCYFKREKKRGYFG